MTDYLLMIVTALIIILIAILVISFVAVEITGEDINEYPMVVTLVTVVVLIFSIILYLMLSKH